MGDEADQEMLDACDRESELQIKPGLPLSSPANGELRNGDTPTAANQEAVLLEIVISEDQTHGLPCTNKYNIEDGSSFTRFIEGLRKLLAEHPEPEHLYDRHPNLSSSKKHPLLAKPRDDQQPGRRIDVKLQVSGQGKGATSSSSTTTLVIRDDNVDVMGFSNHKGVWYELGNNRRMLLPPRYNNSELLAGSWVINKEQVANLLVESCTCLGKTFAVGAVRALHCYPEHVADGVDPRLALVGLSVMVCDSARMNPVLKTIADGWNTGTRITEQLMTDTVGKYEWISRFLWQWSRRNYAKPQPADSDLQTICLVLNGPPEVVYTIGDEVSFISFMTDLRRILSNHRDREDILSKHGDRNLSSTHEHPLLAEQHPVQPARWLHIKLQVVDGEETSWTTLIMRDDNLYVHGFINKQGVVYGLADNHKDSAMVLPDPYMNLRDVERLDWSVEYTSILQAKSNDDVVTKLAGAHLGREFAMKAVRVLSRFPHEGARLALAGLIFMFCESARMNPLHNAFARGWSTGTGFTEELMNLHVWNNNKYSKKSGKLRNWKDEMYIESRSLPHPIKELQDVYLVLNTTSTSSGSTTKEAGYGGGGSGSGGGPSQPGEPDNNAGSSNGSASQPGKAGDAGNGGGSAFQPGGAGHAGSSRGNNRSQPQDVYDDARDDGRPMVEIMAIHADHLDVGTKIIVYDGIRGQIIYRMEEQGKHNEHKEQGEQGMVELVLTGPYTCISAEGCFAIQIEIPDDDAGSNTRDANGPIEWEWDCYDPNYAAEVDKLPVTKDISDSVPSRKVARVTYAVMSNAREATVQVVKFRLKDGQIAAGIGGEITARIHGFEGKYDRSILFRCAKGTRRYFSRIDDDDSWFLLELARNVVAVPCGRVLHIQGNLQIETEDGKEVEVEVALCFDNGIWSSISDDAKEVEVEVTWYPEMARSSKPPEQRTSKEGDEEEFITAPSEKSGPPEVKMVSEKYVTELAYTIGDELSFVSFIMDLRRKLADHQDHEDILDGHGLLNLSSSREHPVLAKQRPAQPARWLHIKLQVVKGKKTSWTTLLMRDDNLYVHGFINQQGVCYQLRDGQKNAWTNILPSAYSPIQLYWGISYRSILGTRTSHDDVDILAGVDLGHHFARKAVRRLSSPRHPDDEAPGMMNARLALSGLILMVCESARMNPLLDFFVRGWSDGTRFTEELMDRYVSRYGDMSSELMTWKSGCYAKSHPIKELQAVYLVLNTMRIRDGASSKKLGNAGSGGGKRKRAFNDSGSSGGPQSNQCKKACNAASSGGPTSKSEDTGDAGSGGGSDSKSEETSDADSGGSPDSQSDESGDADSPGEPEETSDDSGSRGGNNSSGHRRPLVELLSMRADLGVIGNKIIVFDGKRGQIIYTKKEQGEKGRMVDLVLTGPYKGISAYGCFALSIDIPAPAAGSSGDPIQWEWDCYDPKYATEVDKPPVRRTIGDVAEVSYAVMSNAREAAVQQVKLRLKDGPISHGGISGEITALIDGFEDEHKSVLFSCAMEKGQRFSTTGDNVNTWFLLQLARNVVAVPCGRVLHIEVDLQIVTEDGKEVEVKVPLRFDNGISSSKTDDGNEVELEVEVTWYPQIARLSHPMEQIITIKEADEEKSITAPSLEKSSGTLEVNMVPGHQTVMYTIGDELSFTEFIVALRRILADHPDREDVLDGHPKFSSLSSTGEHPVLAKQRAQQPGRWIHVKLQAVKGEEMLSTTLIMRDDNLYVCGFINQQGDSFELIENPDRSADILPVDEYSPRPRRLSWGVGYRSLLDVDTEDHLMWWIPAWVGRSDFLVDAVHVLSRFPAWVDDGVNPRNSSQEKINPRMALAGLMIMVCESARMNPVNNYIARRWSKNDRYVYNNVVHDVFNYGRSSGELLTWKSKGYANTYPISQMQDVYLVLNCRLDHPPNQARGRPRVEMLAMRADLGVVGTTVTVFDGKRGHIIYRKEEQEEKGLMADLVLTGPCISISAYGCFAIKIDIPSGADAGSSSKGDGGGSIKWEWDCYDPKYAEEVDKSPVTRTISSSSGPGRNVEVTYAVISDAREATVQVKLLTKDGDSPRSVHGSITARIGGFKDRVILFKRTQGMGQRLSPTDSSVRRLTWYLKLARNVVSVPRGQMLRIEMELITTETSENQVVRNNPRFINVILSFHDSGSFSQRRKLDDGDEVEVNVAWHPSSGPLGVIRSTETELRWWRRHQADISYKVGDDAEGFIRFINELRRLVTEHPRCKDLMADHPELSSKPNHPVLLKGRRVIRGAVKRLRSFRIKLEAGEEGVEKSWITLVMRDDNLDVIGFINQDGVCYALQDGRDSTAYQQLVPSEHKADFLSWCLDYGSWVQSHAFYLRDTTRLGKNFAEDAVRYLSRFKDREPTNRDAMQPLIGLIIMVCDSARMEPVREAIAGGWNNKDGMELTKQQLQDYRQMWPVISGALLDWKDHAYQGWPQNTELESMGITSPEDALKVVPLVFNDEDRMRTPNDY